jgi:hypothetical protein
MARSSWLDENTQTPLIDDYARELTHFIDALADGRIDSQELKTQEARLVSLMKQVEPKLDDTQHEDVTRLLCEMAAYSVMQVLAEMEASRPKTRLNL